MEAGDLVFTEVREHLGNAFSHLHYALLVVGSNYKAIDVDHGEFLLLPVGAYKKSFEDIKELHSIDWQVHIDMVEPSERLSEAVDISFVKPFSNDFSSTAVEAQHAVFNSVQLGILLQIQVAVWVQIVSDYVHAYASSTNSKWANSTEQVHQGLALLESCQ